MKIRELSIKNCLSFCEKGLNEDDSIQLGDFNLFIGSNNAGKSNVLKLMGLIQRILLSVRETANESLSKFPLSFGGGDPTYFKDWFFAQDLKRKIELSFSLEIEQADQTILGITSYDHYDHKDRDPVLFMFQFKKDWPKVIKVAGLVEFEEKHPSATITKVEIPNDHPLYGREPILFDRENRKILALRPGVSEDEPVWKILHLLRDDEIRWEDAYRPIGKASYNFLYHLYDQIFKDLFINIPAIREIKPGDEVIEGVAKLRDGRQSERGMFFRVQDFIKELIFANRQDINFIFPPSKTNGGRGIEIEVGGLHGLQLPLSHYGSGVEQMLCLAVEIVRKGTNKVILVEEPEAHFHPDLQRKFIRFLRKNKEYFRHQYLLATHSNIFIAEFVDAKENVFYVHLAQEEGAKQEYSQVELLKPEGLVNLLKDLGVKPKDLLLANGILVVEGLTDKDVYTDWARKIGKPFERIALEVIDAEGAGNVSKYLGSDIIQRTCFRNYGLCDKNAENEIRKKLKGIVPDENIIALKKGDLEDYYPRELVLQFTRDWGKIRNKKEEEIPIEIKEGETVKILDRLLGKDRWKRNLAAEVIKKMEPNQIDDEIKDRITEIYDSID